MTMTQGTRRQSSHTSRDFSTHASVMDAPTRRVRSPQPTPQRRRFQHKPGSQQVFSYRGRRIEQKKADRGLVRFVITLTVLLVVGVGIAMGLSGMTTAQSFKLQELRATESTLGNQIETLQRDAANASSTAELAKKAAEMNLVVPDQPGVLATDPEGNVVEQRPASDLTRPIVDINGDAIRARAASSNPEKTEELNGQLNPVPNQSAPRSGNTAPNGATLAPYPGQAPQAPAAPPAAETRGEAR
ncbi:hypothetical protein [Corynebacterium pseudopelargi]|uniref:Cell division protein FtsL n=1 Tax=Corynebacterium pseudopelargi TaxID=2080757 RepID=A0A3G6ITA7_9CORY|nr:hypothetical protein [Corynebacterium pseudopelargi]AZA08921.1 hypothetical protein CPPEL_03965 [Corynebacterium pseudopelargi]